MQEFWLWVLGIGFVVCLVGSVLADTFQVSTSITQQPVLERALQEGQYPNGWTEQDLVQHIVDQYLMQREHEQRVADERALVERYRKASPSQRQAVDRTLPHHRE